MSAGNPSPITVAIGGASKQQLQERLAQASVKLNRLAQDLMADPRFQTTTAARSVTVCLVSAADLGFPQGAVFHELVRAAQAQGLSLCPLELGPHLRPQLPEQAEVTDGVGPPTGQAPAGAITLASAAPEDDDLVPWGFYLRHVDGQLWLRGYCSWSGHRWAPEDVFAFIQTGRADADTTGLPAC